MPCGHADVPKCCMRDTVHSRITWWLDAAGPAVLQTVSRVLADTSGSMVQPLVVRKAGEPLGVCVMTSDFWGLHAAGGTATAYHLLAYVRLVSTLAFECHLLAYAVSASEIWPGFCSPPAQQQGGT